MIMKKQIFGLTLCLVLLGTAGTASAQSQLTWNWAWNGLIYSGSGTITTDPATYTGGGDGYSGSYPIYPITGITGTLDGFAVTGLEYGVVDLVGEGPFDLSSYLQYCYLSPDGNPIDGGFFVSVADGSVDRFLNFGSDPSPVLYMELVQEGSSITADDWGNGSLTSSPVPEPSLLALASLGGLSLLLFRRRK